MCRQFGLMLDDCHCVCCKHDARPRKIDNFIGTCLQNKRGDIATVTSAIDKSIDNNDNDKKQCETISSLVALEIIRLHRDYSVSWHRASNFLSIGIEIKGLYGE